MAKYSYEWTDNCYLTPPSLINGGLKLLSQLKGEATLGKFDLDVCCSNKNIPADEYFTFPDHDGLKEDWKEFNWCNPPFDQCNFWVKKAYAEQQAGKTTIMLIPVRTETKYYHDYILYNKDVDIHWLRKGFKFLDAKTKEESGIFKNALAYIVFKGKNVSQEKTDLAAWIKQRLIAFTKEEAIEKFLDILSVDECKEVLKTLPLKDFDEELEQVLEL